MFVRYCWSGRQFGDNKEWMGEDSIYAYTAIIHIWLFMCVCVSWTMMTKRMYKWKRGGDNVDLLFKIV